MPMRLLCFSLHLKLTNTPAFKEGTPPNHIVTDSLSVGSLHRGRVQSAVDSKVLTQPHWLPSLQERGRTACGKKHATFLPKR